MEGHVPADDIKRLLTERLDIKGLTAPGMPMGSPGMEGSRKDAYDVLALNHNNPQRFSVVTKGRSVTNCYRKNDRFVSYIDIPFFE